MIGILTFFLIVLLVWYLFLSKLNPTPDKPAGPPPPRVEFPRFLVLSLAMLIIGFNLFLYGTSSGLSFPVLGFGLFNLVWLAVYLVSLARTKHSPLVYILTLVSALSGLALSWRANGFVQSVNLFSVVSLDMLLLFIHTQEQVWWQLGWVSKQALHLIPSGLNQIGLLLKQPQARGSQRNVIVTIFKTTALTLVAVIFFVKLLSAADPVFAQIIKDYQEEIIGRTLASLGLAFVVTVLLTLRSKAEAQDKWRVSFLSFSEVLVPVVAIVALFAVFLGVQVNYLFGDHAALASFGLTYSEYVRKGFIELLVTALFGGLISYLLILKGRALANRSHRLQLTAVNSLMLLELFAMLGSALKRDLMYVEVYGLTRVRIIGGLFLLWLAITLGSLLVMALVKKMQEKHHLLVVLAACLGVLLGLNLMNIDQRVIAGTPEHHDYKDYFYINNLSEDGHQGWLESIGAIESDLAVLLTKAELTDVEKSRLAGDKLALISLQEKRLRLFIKYAPEDWLRNYCLEQDCSEQILENEFESNQWQKQALPDEDQPAPNSSELKLKERVQRARDWQHLNQSEKLAYDFLREHRSSFVDQVDSLLEQIINYQTSHSLSLYDQEYRLLREFTYPFINIYLQYQPTDASSPL